MCDPETFCLETIGNPTVEVILEIFLFFYGFIGLAIVCDDHLVQALETLCVRWKIREDVAGATFMALGSAAPEIVISIITTINAVDEKSNDSDVASLGVGAILGSGMIAFLLIPGCCALFAKKELLLKRRPLLRDVLSYIIAVILLLIFLHDGLIQLYEGVVLLVCYFVYILVVVLSPTVRALYREKTLGHPKIVKQTSFVEDVAMEQGLLSDKDKDSSRTEEEWETDIDDSYVKLEADEKENEETKSWYGKFGEYFTLPLHFMFKYTCPECEWKGEQPQWYPVTLATSFLWVAFFSSLITAAVSRWVVIFHVPSHFFGITLVGLGSQIPDTIQSISVAKRGYGTLAVANSIGSQICNIFFGLGLPWTLSNAAGKMVPVGAHNILQVAGAFTLCDVLVLTILLLVFVIVYKEKRARLGTLKGWIFITIYVLTIIIFALYVFNMKEPHNNHLHFVQLK